MPVFMIDSILAYKYFGELCIVRLPLGGSFVDDRNHALAPSVLNEVRNSPRRGLLGW